MQTESDVRDSLRPTALHRDAISLYPVLKPGKHHTLAEPQPSDLTVSDNRHRVDHELFQFSFQNQKTDRPILFLFDRLDPVHARSARQLANKALKEIPDRTAAIAVWTIRERLQLLQDFTADRGLVSAAIDATAITGSSLAAVHTSGNAGIQLPPGVSSQSLLLARQVVSTERIPWWAAALEAAAQTWRPVPGRKAIVYFTEEAPAGTPAAEALTRVSQQLQDASVSLYVVDLNAIDDASMNRADAAMAMGSVNSAARQSAMANATAAARTSRAGPPEKMLGVAEQSRMGETINDLELGNIDVEKPLLRQVAAETAGGYSNAGENLKRLMRSMVHDLINYCEVTYPVPAGTPQAFHQVVVRSRSSTWAGGYLLHTSGESADSPMVGQRRVAPPDTLERLTNGSKEDTLTVHAAILRPPASREAVTVKVPIRELELREDGNTKLFSFHAAIAVEIVDARGQVIVRDEQDFARHGAAEAEEQVRSEYLSFERPVVLLPGDYTVRAVIRDWNSGKTGRDTRRIAVEQEVKGSSGEVSTAQSEAQGSNGLPFVPEADLATGPPRQSLAGQMLDDNAREGENLSLTADQQGKLIDAARSHALSYTEQLPNFLCLETLDRSEDSKGNGVWKHRDSILEKLLYRDGAEQRTVMRVNGENSHASVESLEGTRSHGEFGGVLRSVFDPEAHAAFQWVRSEEDGGVLLQVFRYSVPVEHSAFYVTILGEQQVRAAFDGLIFVDSETQAVRRIAAITRGLPKDFSVRSSWIALSYDYVVVNHHEYLLPSRGEVGMMRRKQRIALNELHFSAYRRFGSHVRMVPAGELVPAHQ